MSYYENRIKALEEKVAEMARMQRHKAIPVEAKLLERIAEYQAENTRLKAEIERCFELVKAVKNERKSAVFKEGVWYVPVEELKQKEADCLVLKAEVARLRASSFVTAVPVEQYERVIKAGDAMAEALNLNDDVFDNQDKREAQANWQAAKEGKQP